METPQEVSEQQRRRSDWTENLHAKVDLLALDVKALNVGVMDSIRSVNNAVRLVYQVPLAIAAMWLAWQARQANSISEHSFIGIFLVCLFPFFGDGIKGLVMLFWGPRQADKVTRTAKTAFLIGAFVLIAYGGS